MTVEQDIRVASRRRRIEIAPACELLKKFYLNEHEVSALTGRSVFTLRNDRFLRRGIPYLIVAKRSIRYRTSDVLQFMERRPISF
jgi:hypothetical protein